ncbi:MAG: phytanoyl-CoA dioxygenase family protein [Myxococcota bacterium]
MYTVGMGRVKTGAIGSDRLEATVQAVREQGFAVVRDVVAPEGVAALGAVVEAQMQALHVEFGGNAFLGLRTRRLFNLLARDPIFRDVATCAATLPVVERLLDDECLLSSMTAIEMHPGQARQPLHCDDGSHGLPRPGPTHGVVAIFALSAFDSDNGGTHVVPGSHRFDRIPKRGDAPPTVQVEMPAGSVLVYDASLWHGGGENRAAVPRRAIVVNYCAGYLRQEECQLLAIPRDQVAEFPPRLRRLVGYGTYRGLLGHVDQRSPETFFDPDAPSDMVWGRIRG